MSSRSQSCARSTPIIAKRFLVQGSNLNLETTAIEQRLGADSRNWIMVRTIWCMEFKMMKQVA